MSATTRPTTRPAGRTLAVLAAVPAALVLVAAPVQAVPDPGAPVAVTSVALAGCDVTADRETFPGWRGPCLPPELRGPVLEFLGR